MISGASRSRGSTAGDPQRIVCRFRFSAFNNLKDISLDPAYGTLLGYTEDEILSSFGPFVENAARVNDMDVPTLMDAMRAQYDGFCFDAKASTHVYAPWSVLSFLKNPELGLQNYWYDSAGQSSMILSYMRTHPVASPESFGGSCSLSLQELRDASSPETLRQESLLYQAGYLSIKERSGNDVVLGYPNREVEESMAQVYVSRMVGGRTLTDIGVPDIGKVLAKGDPDAAMSALNTIFLGIPYDRYPVGSESACRMAVRMLLTGAGIYSELERHNAKGRSDLEFDAGEFRWVLEFKYARKGDDPKRLLAKALVQIRDSRYGEASGGRRLLRVGLVFDGEGRRFVEYGVA